MTENKMGTMPVGKLLFSMSAPMVASMLFQAFYNIVDSVVVAMVSQDALNAVSLAFPVQMLAIAFSAGTGVGMNALISKSLGRNDQEAVDRAANTGIFVYMCTVIVFTVLGIILPRAFYEVQTGNQQIIQYGVDYLSVCLGVCVMLFGQMLFEKLLQSTGRTNLAMIPQIVGACINMILDPILVLGLFGFPRLEVFGAAVATVIGQCVAMFIGFYLNLKKNPEIHIDARLVRPHKETIINIYKIGSASIVMQSVGSFMNFGINNILINFTEAATAVFGAYYKIQSFIFLPVIGMTNAYVPILSFNYGARYFDRVKETRKLATLTAIIIMCIGTILFEFIPHLLIGLFSPGEEMLSVGITAFRIIGIHFPLAGFCIMTSSTCQALDKPMYSLITSLARQLGVLLPAAYFLSLTGNLSMVWLAFPIAEVICLTLSSIFLKKTMQSLE